MVNENVKLDDVFIGRGGWRNFSGTVNENNRSGQKKFSVFLPEELANTLKDIGWNVKRKPPYQEGGDELIFLDVFVDYDHYPPCIRLKSYDGESQLLSNDTVGLLDSVDIARADLEIRPYNWEVNGKTGCKAMVHELTVTAKPPKRSFNASLHRRDDEE